MPLAGTPESVGENDQWLSQMLDANFEALSQELTRVLASNFELQKRSLMSRYPNFPPASRCFPAEGPFAAVLAPKKPFAVPVGAPAATHIPEEVSIVPQAPALAQALAVEQAEEHDLPPSPELPLPDDRVATAGATSSSKSLPAAVMSLQLGAIATPVVAVVGAVQTGVGAVQDVVGKAVAGIGDAMFGDESVPDMEHDLLLARLREHKLARQASQKTQMPLDSLRVVAEEEPANDDRTSERKKKNYKSTALRELAGQPQLLLSDATISRWVNSNQFEVLTGFLILVCSIVMALDIQYRGQKVAYDFGMSNVEAPGEDGWLRTHAALEAVFCVLFSVELLLRFVGLRCLALKCPWVCLDIFLVMCGWLDVFRLLNWDGLNPILLRLLRLARMARLLKVMKASKVFETLFLLVRSVQASFGALVWSFCMLLFLQFCAALFLCQTLADYVVDPAEDEEHRKWVFARFGTFTNAMVTMFEIVMGNWMVIARHLYTHVDAWFALFLIAYRGCFIYAVEKVIVAVFIAETTRAVNNDDNIAILKAQRMKDANCLKLKAIFDELDDSGDGQLSFEEFQHLLTDDLLKAWLSTLNIDTHDLQELFHLLDHGDGQINIDEFTKGMIRVKGPAKNIDVLKLHSNTKLLGNKLDSLESSVSRVCQALQFASSYWSCSATANGLSDAGAIHRANTPSVTDSTRLNL